MPRFRYEAKRGPGEKVDGILEAEDRKSAVTRLRDMGYFPTLVEEHKGGISGPKVEFSVEHLKRALQRIRLNERNIFFRQLANLVESGMLLTRALRTLESQTENPRLAELIGELRDDVQKGQSLADAMERHPNTFPLLYTNLVRAGEAGGMLDEVLWRIVSFGEQEEELRAKARAALVYPAFLTVVGFSAIFILVSFVFPNFVKIFEDFNAELPLPTRIVMGFCNFMGAYWWAVLLAGALLATGTVRYFRTPTGRLKWDTFLLRVPVVKVLVQKYEMAKFSRTLGTLLDNGVPVLTSLRITSDTLGNAVIRDEVSRIATGVTEGEAMSECLNQCKHFPPLIVSMFAIGEESGRIGAVAKRVADAYDIEVDRAVKAFTSLFEPLLIVIMGIIIGFLVVAMLLPILNLSNVV